MRLASPPLIAKAPPMSISNEIALDLLRVFGQNVLSHRVRTYGDYAHLIGRMGASDGLAVGKAMHAIGAVCVVEQLPVAPLFWVESANGAGKSVFESDPDERRYVIEAGNYDTMYVVAREYSYTREEFDRLESRVTKLLATDEPAKWSPHRLWRVVFRTKPKGSPETYFERAMARYREINETLRAARAGQKP